MHKNIDSRYKGFSDIKDSFWGTEAFISRFHCNEIIVTSRIFYTAVKKSTDQVPAGLN
jgi:hypothetical protein